MEYKKHFTQMTQKIKVSSHADIEYIIMSNNEKYAIMIVQVEPDEEFKIVTCNLENPD